MHSDVDNRTNMPTAAIITLPLLKVIHSNVETQPFKTRTPNFTSEWHSFQRLSVADIVGWWPALRQVATALASVRQPTAPVQLGVGPASGAHTSQPTWPGVIVSCICISCIRHGTLNRWWSEGKACFPFKMLAFGCRIAIVARKIESILNLIVSFSYARTACIWLALTYFCFLLA